MPAQPGQLAPPKPQPQAPPYGLHHAVTDAGKRVGDLKVRDIRRPAVASHDLSGPIEQRVPSQRETDVGQEEEADKLDEVEETELEDHLQLAGGLRAKERSIMEDRAVSAIRPWQKAARKFEGKVELEGYMRMSSGAPVHGKLDL